jgi:hypothetical protein
MCHVADTNSVLFLEICSKGSLVVDLEVEDAMLVGKSEGSSVNGSLVCLRERQKVKAVEWGQHGELELE